MDVVLLVVEGPESKYEYLRRIASFPTEVHLIRNTPVLGSQNNWCDRYIPHQSQIFANCRNPTSAIEKVKSDLHRQNLNPIGVTTYRDTAVPLTQYLAESLHLPAICSGDPRLLRNKGAMRAAMRAAGLPQPDFRVCNSRNQAIDAAEELGPPIIVKPAEMVSSLGVQKLMTVSRDAVIGAYDRAVEVDIESERLRYEFNLSPQVVIERFVETFQEVSVEGLVIDAVPTILALTKKRVKALQGLEFAEIGHLVPFTIPGDFEGEIRTSVTKAIRAVGLANCAFHAELLLQTNAPPIITEIGARLAGDFIPMLVEIATGANFIEATIAASCGRASVSHKETHCKYAAIDFFAGSMPLKDLKQAFDEVRTISEVLEMVEYPGASHGRFGHVIYCGNSIADLDLSSDRFQTLVS